MFNIFEQPWTILLVAVIVSLVISVYHWLFPERKRWTHFLIPLIIAVVGLAGDFLVKTDPEKINALLKTGMKAVEEESADAVDAIIAPDYTDSAHNTKEDLMRYCRMMLSRPLVEKNKKWDLKVDVSPPNAAATFTVITRFEPQSYIYQSYMRSLVTKMELHLQKQPDKSWLITRAEILELNHQPANWRDIK
ncbi:MAG TPA: hypothetical protein VMX13_15970 [Sedimentisphaerales bacterium]|nr:hypothetical protein [Sedimentisphaerales bacterium]